MVISASSLALPPLGHTDAGNGFRGTVGPNGEAIEPLVIGREDDGEEMVHGVELERLWVVWDIGGEEGGDGGEDLVQ